MLPRSSAGTLNKLHLLKIQYLHANSISDLYLISLSVCIHFMHGHFSASVLIIDKLSCVVKRMRIPYVTQRVHISLH